MPRRIYKYTELGKVVIEIYRSGNWLVREIRCCFQPTHLSLRITLKTNSNPALVAFSHQPISSYGKPQKW